jgi:Fe-S cluster assembly iron-binding protein IscA
VLVVTESAKQALKEILSRHIGEPDVGLRMVPGSSGEFGLTVDKEEEGDEVVEYEGSKVLLLGHAMNEVLEGCTIDVREANEERRLVISK